MGFCVIIPARHASTRLPGKALADIAGRPMIRHVYERARASGADRVWIATDDRRIAAEGERFGADVIMTDAALPSGSDRIAAAAREIGLRDDQVIVNLQGDEPLMPPALIAQVAALLARRPDADIATLCEPLRDAAAMRDPNVVKVVVNDRGEAMYFSRAPIPWDRATGGAGDGTPARRHVGIYAYRSGYLDAFTRLPPAEYERTESLEQLRALQAGATVLVADAVEPPGPGVDTPADLERVRELFARQA